MAEFATTITTATDAPEPDVTGDVLFFKQGLDFSGEMKSRATPTTPKDGSGPRPTTGLIFPRGM